MSSRKPQGKSLDCYFSTYSSHSEHLYILYSIFLLYIYDCLTIAVLIFALTLYIFTFVNLNTQAKALYVINLFMSCEDNYMVKSI